MSYLKKLFFYCAISFAVTTSLSAENYISTKDYDSNCHWYDALKIGGEWLYWKAEQSQMEIASNIEGSNPFTTLHSEAILPEFEYSNGYRIFANYLLNDCWTIDVSLSHLPSTSSVSVSDDPEAFTTNFVYLNSVLFPIFTAFTQAGLNFSSLNCQWKLNLYYLDFCIRRKICLCNRIMLEPYAGVRGFWMKQKLQIDGDSPNADEGPASFTTFLTEEFCGGGLLGGINVCWQWGCGFSFIGQFGGSLVYSSWNSGFDSHTAQAGNTLEILQSNKSHQSHPSVDSFIGLQYFFPFQCCSATAHIGWENHLFFYTNKFTLTANGDLTLQGLTLGGNICF